MLWMMVVRYLVRRNVEMGVLELAPCCGIGAGGVRVGSPGDGLQMDALCARVCVDNSQEERARKMISGAFSN